MKNPDGANIFFKIVEIRYDLWYSVFKKKTKRKGCAVNPMKKVKLVTARKVEMQPVETRVKKVEQIPAYPKKTTNIRTELCDGCYMITYYYRRGSYGEFLAEDIDSATHFERAVYDKMNHLLGSTSGRLSDKIRW